MSYLEVIFRILPHHDESNALAEDREGAVAEDLAQTCADLLSALLADCGFESFEQCGDCLKGYVRKEDFDPTAVRAVADGFPIPDIALTYDVREMEDRDWNETWEAEGFEPIVIAGKCRVRDERRPLPQPVDSQQSYPIDITIGARMAFGTGTHQTTQGVLSMLLDMDLHGLRLLDCGCGTGILSVVALLHGAKEAVAYDVDHWSVENTMHNAAVNGVSDRLTVRHGDRSVLTAADRAAFDVVVANINRNILIEDIHAIRACMKSDACLVVSGFLAEDASAVVSAFAREGLRETKRQILPAPAGTESPSEDSPQWCVMRFEA